MRSSLTAPPGGVMTEEVGAITGQIEVWLEDVTARVAYAGAKDTYTVSGSPVPAGTSVEQVIARLSTEPAADAHGNAVATDLRDLGAETDSS